MITEIGSKMADIELLCKRFGVSTLELFGSAANGNFRDDSDLDFLVEFADQGVEGYSNRYLACWRVYRPFFTARRTW